MLRTHTHPPLCTLSLHTLGHHTMRHRTTTLSTHTPSSPSPQADGTRSPFPPRHAHDARVLIISSSTIMLLQNTTATASRRGRGRSPASLLLAGLCLLGLFLGGQGAEDYYKILVCAWLVWREEGREAEGWIRGGEEGDDAHKIHLASLS